MRAIFPHSLASHRRQYEKSDSVYVLFCAFKMFKVIERPANCEIRSVIRFLNAINMKPDDIRRQICEVYGKNAMSDGMVRKWVRKFTEGRDNVHDEPRSGRPAVFKSGRFLRGGDTETGAPLW
jgi:hypothetical protein